mmetsp:Transcript_22101/g.63407  ORF Transcript_22101/g.63407 Transcript_22101/m.63407 type:complete len:223 (-) Transcript_22101:359-1027(-)
MLIITPTSLAALAAATLHRSTHSSYFSGAACASAAWHSSSVAKQTGTWSLHETPPALISLNHCRMASLPVEASASDCCEASLSHTEPSELRASGLSDNTSDGMSSIVIAVDEYDGDDKPLHVDAAHGVDVAPPSAVGDVPARARKQADVACSRASAPRFDNAPLFGPAGHGSVKYGTSRGLKSSSPCAKPHSLEGSLQRPSRYPAHMRVFVRLGRALSSSGE